MQNCGHHAHVEPTSSGSRATCGNSEHSPRSSCTAGHSGTDRFHFACMHGCGMNRSILSGNILELLGLQEHHLEASMRVGTYPPTSTERRPPVHSSYNLVTSDRPRYDNSRDSTLQEDMRCRHRGEGDNSSWWRTQYKRTLSEENESERNYFLNRGANAVSEECMRNTAVSDVNSCPPLVQGSELRRSYSDGPSFDSSLHSGHVSLKQIALHDWCIKFSATQDTSSLQPGFPNISIGGFRRPGSLEVDYVETSSIVKRMERCKLLTCDGVSIILIGVINERRSLLNGFPREIVHSFMVGFPASWTDIMLNITAGTSTKCPCLDKPVGISMVMNHIDGDTCCNPHSALQKQACNSRDCSNSDISNADTLSDKFVASFLSSGPNAVTQEIPFVRMTSSNVDLLPTSALPGTTGPKVCLGEPAKQTDESNEFLGEIRADVSDPQIETVGVLKDCTRLDREVPAVQSSSVLAVGESLTVDFTGEAVDTLKETKDETPSVAERVVNELLVRNGDSVLKSDQEDTFGCVVEPDAVGAAVQTSCHGDVTSQKHSTCKEVGTLSSEIMKDQCGDIETVSDDMMGVDDSEAQILDPLLPANVTRLPRKVVKPSKQGRRKKGHRKQEKVEHLSPHCKSLGALQKSTGTRKRLRDTVGHSNSACLSPGKEHFAAGCDDGLLAVSIPWTPVQISAKRQRKHGRGANEETSDAHNYFQITKGPSSCQRHSDKLQKSAACSIRSGRKEEEENVVPEIAHEEGLDRKEAELPTSGTAHECRRSSRARGSTADLSTKEQKVDATCKKLHCPADSKMKRKQFGNRSFSRTKPYAKISFPEGCNRSRDASTGLTNELDSEVVKKTPGEELCMTGKQPKRRKSSKKEKCLRSSSPVRSSPPAEAAQRRTRNKLYSNQGSFGSYSILPPPLPSARVDKSKVPEAFGLKKSARGRVLVPPLAFWRNQSIGYDKDGGIIAIFDGFKPTETESETGCFNFKPPENKDAKSLQRKLRKAASTLATKRPEKL